MALLVNGLYGHVCYIESTSIDARDAVSQRVLLGNIIFVALRGMTEASIGAVRCCTVLPQLSFESPACLILFSHCPIRLNHWSSRSVQSNRSSPLQISEALDPLHPNRIQSSPIQSTLQSNNITVRSRSVSHVMLHSKLSEIPHSSFVS